jgi:hypothetical protein
MVKTVSGACRTSLMTLKDRWDVQEMMISSCIGPIKEKRAEEVMPTAITRFSTLSDCRSPILVAGKGGAMIKIPSGCRKAEQPVQSLFGLTPLEELFVRLSDNETASRYASAKANKTCKICGERAVWFRDALAKLEYDVSAICQRCQDKYF